VPTDREQHRSSKEPQTLI